jgi:hypothetical protein
VSRPGLKTRPYGSGCGPGSSDPGGRGLKAAPYRRLATCLSIDPRSEGRYFNAF